MLFFIFSPLSSVPYLRFFIVSFLFCVHCASNTVPSRYPDSLLRTGTLTAPEGFCLVLLRSRPDTVHRASSRETHPSTPLIRGSATNLSPRHNITPAIADCRCRVPLTPRLHVSNCTLFFRDCQGRFRKSFGEHPVIFLNTLLK